jgi:hypothetical protein
MNINDLENGTGVYWFIGFIAVGAIVIVASEFLRFL